MRIYCTVFDRKSARMMNHAETNKLNLSPVNFTLTVIKLERLQDIVYIKWTLQLICTCICSYVSRKFVINIWRLIEIHAFNANSVDPELFTLSTGISVNRGNNKSLSDTSFTGNGPVQRVKVKESTRHKWIKPVFVRAKTCPLSRRSQKASPL